MDQSDGENVAKLVFMKISKMPGLRCWKLNAHKSIGSWGILAVAIYLNGLAYTTVVKVSIRFDGKWKCAQNS